MFVGPPTADRTANEVLISVIVIISAFVITIYYYYYYYYHYNYYYYLSCWYYHYHYPTVQLTKSFCPRGLSRFPSRRMAPTKAPVA